MARTYNYYDFRDAKVNIAHALMAKGWEVFGYSADQSDMMTDYYCPAHWNGVASKNGYVLLVDVSSLSDSGRTITKRTFNGTTKDVQSKITKLQNMTTDKGASQQEEESAKAAIEKLLEKQNEGWTEEVVAVYPEFKNVNPSTSKWHIEKDGVLVDKGTGIGKFSDLPYNWDGTTNHEDEDRQKAINAFNKFISRIEKIVNTITVTDGSEVGSADVETMQLVTEQVTKTVTKPVQVEKENIEVGDYLKFAHRGGFWLVTNNYEVNGKTRISYENVGSEKRGYQQLKNCTRYYDLEERMMKSIQEGKTIIHQMKTFDEITEVEKWVKVGKAPRASKEAVIVDTEEVVTVNEETATGETAEVSNGVTMVINEELNGIELKFSKTLTEEELSTLYANGFKWSKRGGKWYAKQTPKRLEFAQALVTPSNTVNGDSDTEPQDTQEKASETVTDNQNDNVIYYEFSQNEAAETTKQEGDTVDNTYINNDTDYNVNETNFNYFDDIFNKFNNIEITADQKVSGEDLEFCKEQEIIYKELISNYNEFYERLQIIGEKDKEHGKKYGNQSGTYFHTQNTAFNYAMSKYDYQDAINKLKNSFVGYICHYFENKYSITIEDDKIKSKYKENVTYDNIIDEIHEQMGGYNFTEKAVQEIKEEIKKIVHCKYDGSWNLAIRNNKIVIDGYFSHYDSIWKEHRISTNIHKVFNALQNFDDGSISRNSELFNKYYGYQNERNAMNYERYEPYSLEKVKSIKILKNGKMEIEFTSNQVAAKFANEYCGYNQQSA